MNNLLNIEYAEVINAKPRYRKGNGFGFRQGIYSFFCDKAIVTNDDKVLVPSTFSLLYPHVKLKDVSTTK